MTADGEQEQVQCLLHFAHKLHQFRKPELEALLKRPVLEDLSAPFVVIFLHSSEIQTVRSRSVLVKSVFEFWAKGNNYEELQHKLLANCRHFFSRYFGSTESWCLRIETFGRKINSAYIIDRIERNLSFLPIEGPVNLKDPDHTYFALEDFGESVSNVKEKVLKCVYFGRFIGRCQSDSVDLYNLQDRKYIGNTSMDPGLSMLMTNIASLFPGDIAMDPFCGTGSIMIGAAHHGVHSIGADISWQAVYAQGKSSRVDVKYRSSDESIAANFEQYNFPHCLLGVLAADASLDLLWRCTELFDAIITDPPYGLRERITKLGPRDDRNSTVPEQHLAKHIPAKTTYSISSVYTDLLSFAATRLKVGGRLVYWFPSYVAQFSNDVLPQHPALKLVAHSQQNLHGDRSRYLIVMSKERCPCDYEKAEFVNNIYEHRNFRSQVEMTKMKKRQKSNTHDKVFE